MGNIQNKLYFADNGKCLGWHEGPTKPYQWLHYNETLLRARNFGSGLVAMGLAPAATTYVGIYSQNCPEWILVEQGAYCYSMVIVPLYDTLGPDACAFIINQGNAYVVIPLVIHSSTISKRGSTNVSGSDDISATKLQNLSSSFVC